MTRDARAEARWPARHTRDADMLFAEARNAATPPRFRYAEYRILLAPLTSRFRRIIFYSRFRVAAARHTRHAGPQFADFIAGFYTLGYHARIS